MPSFQRGSLHNLETACPVSRRPARASRRGLGALLVLVLGFAAIESGAEDWLRLAEAFASAADGSDCSIVDARGEEPGLDDALQAARVRVGAICLIRNGRYPESLAVLERGRDRSAEPDAALDALLGISLYHVGAYPEALSRFDAAGEGAARSGLAAFYRGLTLLQMGQAEAASAVLRRALALEPELLTDGAVHYYSVLSEIEAGDVEAAHRVSRLFSGFGVADTWWRGEVERLLASAD